MNLKVKGAVISAPLVAPKYMTIRDTNNCLAEIHSSTHDTSIFPEFPLD